MPSRGRRTQLSLSRPRCGALPNPAERGRVQIPIGPHSALTESVAAYWLTGSLLSLAKLFPGG